MNEQNLTPNPMPPVSPVSEVIVPTPVPPTGKFKELFSKFYSNKKIFWPVSIALGLLFLTLVIGLIFGSKSDPTRQVKGSPTPISEVSPTEMPAGDKITTGQGKLGDLKSRIDELDVKQSRLTPPVIDYKIRF